VRAVQISQFGGPEVLETVDVDVPVPAEGEVLIRVTRAGVNFADTHQSRNEYVANPQLPFVPGAEVAGVREDTGERVVALCQTGGYAEFVSTSEERCVPIPDGVDDDTALALMVQGLTAWHLYRTVAHLSQGESVAVIAAAGGVGAIAVQLGHAMGAGRVIAVASTEDKRAMTLELGADAAIDASPDGLCDRLTEANGGRPIDVVFEMAGGQVFDECFNSLAPFGRLCVCGIATRETNRVSSGALLKHSRSLLGFWLFHCFADPPRLIREPLEDLFARAQRGELKVSLGGVYPLEQAAQALADLAARRTTGKLLIDPTSVS
jgi:NADPH2:quinone reductase